MTFQLPPLCHGSFRNLHSSINRREALQVGSCGLLGLGLPTLLAQQSRAAESRAVGEKRARSVILIFLPGAPSHLDMFDLKPEAPVEVRGTFNSIATRTPGYEICEHLPKLAARSDKYAVIRSMTHGFASHEHGTHMLLSGIDKMPIGWAREASRVDWPCYASTLDYLRPRRDGIPNGITLPTYLNLENSYGLSGQNAGFLGAKYDPWHVKQDPNDPKFRVENLNLSLPVGLSVDALGHRRQLLAQFNAQSAALDRDRSAAEFSSYQDQAINMLTASDMGRAFAIDQEPAAVRNNYGRHLFGQSLLLSRRLVQAGVPIVQANMGALNNWDTHYSNFTQLKNRLLPPLDQGVSALLDDLSSSGLLDETLVVMVGEFGRTPKLGKGLAGPDGRDHWSGVFFALFAGAGVRGGQVIGTSDNFAAYPASNRYYPSDLGATIFQSLGIDPRALIKDRFNSPVHASEGEPIAPLFTGAAS